MSLLKFEGMASHRMLVKGTLPHTPPTTAYTRLVPLSNYLLPRHMLPAELPDQPTFLRIFPLMCPRRVLPSKQ